VSARGEGICGKEEIREIENPKISREKKGGGQKTRMNEGAFTHREGGPASSPIEKRREEASGFKGKENHKDRPPYWGGQGAGSSTRENEIRQRIGRKGLLGGGAKYWKKREGDLWKKRPSIKVCSARGKTEETVPMIDRKKRRLREKIASKASIKKEDGKRRGSDQEGSRRQGSSSS